MSNIDTLKSSVDKNVKLFLETILTFKSSQGFYSRLYRDILEMDEDELFSLIDELKKQNFNEVLDVVLWLEG